MSLESKTVLITGASGIVGSGILKCFLKEKATVIAPSRSEASRQKLRDSLEGAQFSPGSLLLPVADWGKPEGADLLAQYIETKAGGVVDHVVSVSGGMVPLGLLTSHDPATVVGSLQARVVGHLLLAKHVLPLLRQKPTSSYTVVSGMLGETEPQPDMALFAVVNSAVHGFVKGLMAETHGAAYRLNELRIGVAVCPDAQNSHPDIPGLTAYPTSKVGARAVEVAKSDMRGQVVRVCPADLS